MDPDVKEAWDYLQEVVGDYERYLSQIGELGLAAPQVLYYRDEVQEFLDLLKGNAQVDFRGVWVKVKKLDDYLREHSQELVDEVGHKNFIQYQVINDPPRAHWWWYLNRVTTPPAAPRAFWQFWQARPQEQQPEEEPQAPPDP